MAAPSIVLDGTMVYGTQPVTISGTTYAVNSQDPTMPTKTAEDETATGAPNRKRWTKDRWQLTMELQLASGATNYPVFGQTFTRTINSESGSLNFVVTEVGEPRTNSSGDIAVCTISAEQVIYAITTVA